MRKFEIAVIRCAVKRSIHAGSMAAGFQHLKAWEDARLTKGIPTDMREILKCFRKWVKHKYL